MLVIRDAQMEVLRQSLVEDFRQRALEDLKGIAGQKDLAIWRHAVPYNFCLLSY